MADEPNEELVDHLAQVFWEAHAPAMLARAKTLNKKLPGASKLDEPNTSAEAVRIGIRAVLLDSKAGRERISILVKRRRSIVASWNGVEYEIHGIHAPRLITALDIEFRRQRVRGHIRHYGIHCIKRELFE